MSVRTSFAKSAPRRLKRLVVDDVSSVDRAANPHARVAFFKRDGIIHDAVRALDMSIASIAADDDVRDKRGAIAESLGQFQDYVRKNGIDVGTADAAAAEIIRHHAPFLTLQESRSKMENPVEKMSRAMKFGDIVQNAITEYAKTHKVSRSVATDKVLLGSPQISEYHRLDKALHFGEQDAIMDRAMRKAERSAKEVQFDDMVNSLMRQGMSRSMAYKAVMESKTGGDLWKAICDLAEEDEDGGVGKVGSTRKPKSDFPSMSPEDMRTRLNRPGDPNPVGTADEMIARIAAEQMRDHPALTKSQAIERAMYHPDVAAAARREKVAKGL
jgi:hypothetical protein